MSKTIERRKLDREATIEEAKKLIQKNYTSYESISRTVIEEVLPEKLTYFVVMKSDTEAVIVLNKALL
jgi:hypothetical protein